MITALSLQEHSAQTLGAGVLIGPRTKSEGNEGKKRSAVSAPDAIRAAQRRRGRAPPCSAASRNASLVGLDPRCARRRSWKGRDPRVAPLREPPEGRLRASRLVGSTWLRRIEQRAEWGRSLGLTEMESSPVLRSVP